MNAQDRVYNRKFLKFCKTVFGGLGILLRGCLFRCCLLLVFCIILAEVIGCIYIPLPENDLRAGRGKIDKEDVASFKVGKTTQEDVLLRFGEPDVVLYDQRVLAYHWEVNVGFWIPLAGNGNPGDTSVNKGYLLMFEFDEQGRLKRFKTITSLWPMSRRKVEEWARKDNKKIF